MEQLEESSASTLAYHSLQSLKRSMSFFAVSQGHRLPKDVTDADKVLMVKFEVHTETEVLTDEEEAGHSLSVDTTMTNKSQLIY